MLELLLKIYICWSGREKHQRLKLTQILRVPHGTWNITIYVLHTIQKQVVYNTPDGVIFLWEFRRGKTNSKEDSGLVWNQHDIGIFSTWNVSWRTINSDSTWIDGITWKLTSIWEQPLYFDSCYECWDIGESCWLVIFCGALTSKLTK